MCSPNTTWSETRRRSIPAASTAAREIEDGLPAAGILRGEGAQRDRELRVGHGSQRNSRRAHRADASDVRGFGPNIATGSAEVHRALTAIIVGEGRVLRLRQRRRPDLPALRGHVRRAGALDRADLAAPGGVVGRRVHTRDPDRSHRRPLLPPACARRRAAVPRRGLPRVVARPHVHWLRGRLRALGDRERDDLRHLRSPRLRRAACSRRGGAVRAAARPGREPRHSRASSLVACSPRPSWRSGLHPSCGRARLRAS